MDRKEFDMSNDQTELLLLRIAALERKSDQDDETILWQAKEISDKIDRIAELELLLEEVRSGKSGNS